MNIQRKWKGTLLCQFVAFGLLLVTVHADAPSTCLPGTSLLSQKGDLAAQMVDGIHSLLSRETSASLEDREQYWKRDYSSLDRYLMSVSSNRERFRKIIGAVDPRLPANALELSATTSDAGLVAKGMGYKVFAVRWPVFEGVDAEGLLLEPDKTPVARVVAVPDADWSPEMIVGIAPGIDPRAQFARRLAENGCQVLVPTIIDRSDKWSGIEGIQMTNQPHREWIYRMAYEVGRHIIGYEVQKVLAAIDWFDLENKREAVPVGVTGYGEGGLLALYSAALDPRVKATLVSGYFQSRQEVWKEPIYHDLWSLLREFGDAELASLIAPRALVVEASQGPRVKGPPAETKERTGACPNGQLISPPLSSVRLEFERTHQFFENLRVADNLHLVVSGDGQGPAGSERALQTLWRLLGVSEVIHPSGQAPDDLRHEPDSSRRMHRQIEQLVNYTQKLIQQSPRKREQFWSDADSSSPERWIASTRDKRQYIWDEVIGRLPSPTLPTNARTRLVYDEPKFVGYEVMLDVWPDVFAFGILLVPKDIGPGERRPVVVCQHGLEGRPEDVAGPGIDSPYYHRFAVRLAEMGFVTYAPQNPYIGKDRFRLIQRKGHPLKLSLFSFVLGQHQRTLEWLSQLAFVDKNRIGFYGLSYGGKTAVRIPPLLEGYALSICSADFNEWVWKNTNLDSRYSYMLTSEYDMIEFDFANVVNYSELATLMAPRPFMVERGHHDQVAPDEWVAFEFAKVKRFYVTRMHLPDSAEIEFFDGPHTINGQGTFEFLKRHLRWPQ